VSLDSALELVGLPPGATKEQVKRLRRKLLKANHPDRNTSEDAHIRSATLSAAFDVIERAIDENGGLTVPLRAHSPDGYSTKSSWSPPFSSVGADHDGDTIFIAAPPGETFQILLDASSSLGGIGHIDRNLGLLEVIVRFEGGPSCSVLFTLQGRAHGTDVFSTMDSIEAAPTPSILPVLDALVNAIAEQT